MLGVETGDGNRGKLEKKDRRLEREGEREGQGKWKRNSHYFGGETSSTLLLHLPAGLRLPMSTPSSSPFRFLLPVWHAGAREPRGHDARMCRGHSIDFSGSRGSHEEA